MPYLQQGVSLILLICMGLFAIAEDEPPAAEDLELSQEEARAAINRLAPLPEWDSTFVGESVAVLLPTDEIPDYGLLKTLQLEEKIREAEARIELEYSQQRAIDLEGFFETIEYMFIRDPKKFLTYGEQQELQELLLTHAGESSSNIHLNILSKNEIEQVAALQEEKHIEILAGDDEGIVVYYFYDDPAHSMTYFSDKAVIPMQIRNEITSSAVREASIQGAPYQALYRYLLDFTLRLTNYLDESEGQPAIVEAPPEVRVAEVEAPVLPREPSAIMLFIQRHLWPLVAGGAALSVISLLGATFYIWNKRYRLFRYRIETIPVKFGFPRAQRCSGMIHFGKGAEPLKKQEDKLFGSK